MDLVELVEDRDLDAGDSRQGDRARWRAVRRQCAAGWGRGAGTRLETVMSAVAAGPRLPAASTACTESLSVAPAASFKSRRCISTRCPACAASGISSRGNGAAIERDEEAQRSRRPVVSGVIHETSASPAGKRAVAASRRKIARGSRRPVVVRARLDREIGRTRPVLIAAVDKPVGKEPEVEFLAGSGPFRAGVVENEEAMAESATRAATTRGSTAICCQPSRSGGDASAMRQSVPPLPRTTWQRSPPPIDQGRSGCRRWRKVAPPG